MPYNPQVQYKGSDYLFQGISSFGDSIAGGISKRAENKKTKDLEDRLRKEKKKMEREEYKEMLLRAQALEQDPDERKNLETKSVGELKGFVQSGMDRLLREYQTEQTNNLRAQATAAQERTRASQASMTAQADELARRQQFNKIYQDLPADMDPRARLIQAASQSGTMDPRQPSAYMPETTWNPSLTNGQITPTPIKGDPNRMFIQTSNRAGQVVDVGGPNATRSGKGPGPQVSVSDWQKLREMRQAAYDELTAGGVTDRRKQELYDFVAQIDARLGVASPSSGPAPSLGGSRFQVTPMQ